MIHGVQVTPLRIIADERGAVLHMLKHSDPSFAGFGEIYFSKLLVGQRKAWRRHAHATSQLAVPNGCVRFVLCDQREGSISSNTIQEVEIGESSYQLLTIPPKVWFALQCVGSTDALIANCSSNVHDPTAVERQDVESQTIPYVWRD
jgi:dTDP-4-dehydrorhamnose 3,5-epimerase